MLALVPLWMPSALSAANFSIAFLIPFAILAWTEITPSNRPSRFARLARTAPSGWSLEILCIAIALACAVISMVASPQPERAARVILPMLYGFSAMVIFTRLSPLSGRRLVYATLVAGVLVTGVALLLAQMNSTRMLVMQDYRLSGFFDNPNQPALVAIIFVPILVALLLGTRNWLLRGACFIAFLIFSYGLLMTGTKTGIGFAFAAGGGVWLYHAMRSGSVGKGAISTVLVLLFIAAVAPALAWLLSWISPITAEKIDTILTDGVSNYQSIQSRNLLWADSIKLGLERPLTGVGAGSLIGVPYSSHSHNMVIDYLRGMGVFGATSALLLLILVLVRTGRFLATTLLQGPDNRTKDTLIAAFYLGATSYMLGNQISDSFSPSTSFFFWMVYLSATVSAKASDRVTYRRVVGPANLQRNDRPFASQPERAA